MPNAVGKRARRRAQYGEITDTSLVGSPRRRANAMAHSDTPHPPKLLPDAIHRAVKPGTALLRLETTGSRQGILDGAWWPRSRDIGSELPGLITALARHLGPITRVGLDADAWDGLPTRLIIDDRVVHIVSYPVGDDTILVTRGDHDHFTLLVIPPHATPEAAHTAMAQAVEADNVTSATQILIDTAIDPAAPSGSGEHRPEGREHGESP
jgi:hypothetical protein